MRKQILFSLFLVWFIGSNFAQIQEPVNSNLLYSNGITPRTLDFAVSALLQDGEFSQDVKLTIKNDSLEKDFLLELIYDPEVPERMDIQLVVKSGNLSKKEKKKMIRFIEESHYFSRQSHGHLFDESSLKLVRSTNDTIVLSYLYKKKDIEPYLANIKRFTGKIFIVHGQLEKIELTNTKKLKHGINNYKKEIHYQRTEDGGYIVTSYTERFTDKKGNQFNLEAITSNYQLSNGSEIMWEGKPAKDVEATVVRDTLDVNLGGKLPFLGKAATKMGFKLPRPYGVAGFIYAHSQNMDFTGLEVGFDNNKMVNLDNLFALEDSRVVQSTYMPLVKADVWIFPFLNVMFIAGGGENKLDGELVINQEVRDFFDKLPGWIIDIPNIPRSIPIVTTITSEVYGGGLTLAGGIDNVNFSVNYQLMFTKIVEAHTTNMVNVVTPMIGYMTPFGLNLMLGGQGQFYNTKISGFIELNDKSGNPHKLNYNVNFEPIKWNAIVGIYKGFSNHWEMSFQAGFGQRTSLTAILGYRF